MVYFCILFYILITKLLKWNSNTYYSCIYLQMNDVIKDIFLKLLNSLLYDQLISAVYVHIDLKLSNICALICCICCINPHQD